MPRIKGNITVFRIDRTARTANVFVEYLRIDAVIGDDSPPGAGRGNRSAGQIDNLGGISLRKRVGWSVCQERNPSAAGAANRKFAAGV